MRKFGLIGYPLSHSFSERYFKEKFEKEGITDCSYELFPIRNILHLNNVLEDNDELKGLTVTIPYKEVVIPYLKRLEDTAPSIGAVNTIKIVRERESDGPELIGYNTDAHGFSTSLTPLLTPAHQKALILGTGGASKAVSYVLDQLQIEHKFVSRDPKKDQLSYPELDKDIMHTHTLIVNTTPLGMSHNESESPDIPYDHLNDSHLLYDLIYNPAETLFLQKGASFGAATKNGLEMLHLQADKAWEIWNS